jgi:hypothetical protein
MTWALHAGQRASPLLTNRQQMPATKKKGGDGTCQAAAASRNPFYRIATRLASGPRHSVEALSFIRQCDDGPPLPTALDSRGIGRLLCRALICYNLLGWGTHREFTWEVSTMSHAKRASKRRSRAKAVTVMGVAGALSLAGGASGAAVGPPGDTQTANTAVTLYEEEISDVSLSTFYVFDHENVGARRPGLQLTQRTRSRPRQGSGGCAVDDCAGGGPRCCASCATLNGGCQ